MRISRTVARCDRPSFNEGALHLARCERRHRLQVGNSALRSRNDKRWYRLLVRWSLEDEHNVVFARRQVKGDKLSPNPGDEPANDLRTILGRGNHCVKAFLREAGLCNKCCHVILPIFSHSPKQVADCHPTNWPWLRRNVPAQRINRTGTVIDALASASRRRFCAIAASTDLIWVPRARNRR